MKCPALVEEIAGWVIAEIDRANADIVVLCGNHMFRLLPVIAERRKELAERCVHPNALRYTLAADRYVQFIADETEYGRHLHEVLVLLGAAVPKGMSVSTAFLSTTPHAAERREQSCKFLAEGTAVQRKFAEALRAVRFWRAFADDADFHNKAIVRLRSAFRSWSRAPFNADATLFDVELQAGDGDALSTLHSELGGLCDVYRPTQQSMTFLFPRFSPGAWLTGTAPGLRLMGSRAILKVYGGDSESVFRASPMVHSRMRFSVSSQVAPVDGSTLPAAMLGVATSRLTTTEAQERYLAAYDVLSFALDVGLAGALQRRCRGALRFRPDIVSLHGYYGRELGDDLLGVVRDYLASPDTRVPDLGKPFLASGLPAATPQVSLPLLLCAKRVALSHFSLLNQGVQDPILSRRSGPSIAELSRATHTDGRTAGIVVDLLCELEATEPFNRLKIESAGDVVAERCYNTTHEGVSGLLSKVIQALEAEGLPRQQVMLNKLLSYLGHVCLGHASESGIDVDRHHFGTVVRLRLEDDPTTDPLYLNEFLEEERGVFACGKDGNYSLVPGADPQSLERHFTLVSSDELDPQIQLFVDAYRTV